ncbi:hypothetical protein E4T56_gene3741 [Termitomyces sp. T112]|nr:hypothetical protein E4T56_gene3741 [Termitomyces sp. T112]
MQDHRFCTRLPAGTKPSGPRARLRHKPSLYQGFSGFARFAFHSAFWYALSHTCLVIDYFLITSTHSDI